MSLWSKIASSVHLICLYNMQSSANSLIVECLMTSGRSFMYIENSMGPRTVPCGTPEVTGIGEEIEPSMITC